MKEIKVFNENLNERFKSELTKLIHDFEVLEGGLIGRNVIKTVEVDGVTLNIKAFKIPNKVNQIMYAFFRKSKAQRSFEYAKKLLELEVKTPKPFGYFEYKTSFLFKKSFYVSEQLDYDLTAREITIDFNYPNYEEILRAFTRFTHDLHQKGVNFLDHSPGNTLIKKRNNDYDFYLVDLNRMVFKILSFNERIKNFNRLNTHKELVKIMSDEYARITGEDFNRVFSLMWKETNNFQDKYYRKYRWKKRLLFWR